MAKFIIRTSTILTLVLYSKALLCNLYEPKIITTSIPKSGTFLLANYISALTGNQFIVNYVNKTIHQPLELFDLLPDKHFFITHLAYTNAYREMIIKNNYSTLFIYRDPRDQLISFVYWIYKNPERWPNLQELNINDLIFVLINKMAEITYDIDGGIKEYFDLFIPWLNCPEICSVRFEDLIGPQGGGTMEQQLTSLYKIADHLKITLSKLRAEEIAQKVFGGPGTFREGKIGNWKTHFTEEHKVAFKTAAGQMLINLGYERDLDW